MSRSKRGPRYPNELPRMEIRPGLLARLEANVNFEAELDLVQRKLAQATQRMETVGDGGRYGLALAMRGLEEYFSNLGIPRATLFPIISVIAAIDDARHGIESPIFRPERAGKRGAPSIAIQELERRAYIAVILECCMNHLKKQKVRPYARPAKQMAQKLLRDAGWRPLPDLAQLGKIRERVQEAGAGDPAFDLYRAMMDSEAAQMLPRDYAHTIAFHDWMVQPPDQSLID